MLVYFRQFLGTLLFIPQSTYQSLLLTGNRNQIKSLILHYKFSATSN